MDDVELTAALASLGLDRDNHRAVMLLPLVEVAWADGRVQRAERRRIGQIARNYGIQLKDGWLERWLSRRPSVKTFLAARTVLLALMARNVRYRLGGEPGVPEEEEPAASPPRPASKIETLEGLLDLCERVAEAAGGLFGLAFTVARSERDCIEQIAASLSLGPAVPAVVVDAWEQSRRRHFLAEAPTSARRRGPRYGILDQTTHHLNLGAAATRPLESTKATLLLESPPPLERALDSRPAAPGMDRPPGSAGAKRRRPSLGPDDSTAPFDTLAARAARAAMAAPPPPPRPAPEPAKVAVPPSLVRPAPSGPDSVLGPNSASGPRVRRRGGNTAIPTSERFQEEDDTLPFFDDVNVGTYAMDSED